MLPKTQNILHSLAVHRQRIPCKRAWRVVCVLSLSLIAAQASIACGAPAGAAAPPRHLLVVGSTALQPFVAAAAQLYQKQQQNTQITVQGGGSVTGLNAINNHQADIGDSDLYADPAIYTDPLLTDHLVCAIPFALVTNDRISISSLTHQQIIDIFSTGKITNWKEVGGPDLPIVPIIRPITSGTRAVFSKYILDGQPQNGMRLTSDTSQSVHDTVANTAGAIGYLALSIVDSRVHPLAIDGAPPTPGNIENGSYHFWSYEHMYTSGNDSPTTTDFINFLLTPQLQQIARQMHYIPINDIKIQAFRAQVYRDGGNRWFLRPVLADPVGPFQATMRKRGSWL